jgi:hypothetical protein
MKRRVQVVLEINLDTRTIFLADSLSSADSWAKLMPLVQHVFACLVALIPAVYRMEQGLGPSDEVPLRYQVRRLVIC